MQKTSRKGKNIKNNVADVDVVIEDSMEYQTKTTKKTTKEPTVKEPTVKDPTVNEPTVNDPTINDPTVNDPTVNDPTVNDPIVKKITAKEPTAKKATKVSSKESNNEITKEKIPDTPIKKNLREPKPDVAVLPLCQANIINSVDDIIASIEIEIQNIREGVTTKGGVKFLRSINKNVKTLRTKAMRVMKQKPVKINRINERNNTNSGFLKQVPISKEMCNFAGWGTDELHSRVDVTKFVCNYIKENNLQNPADRRQITPDAKLKKLLNYISKNGEPLKYYTLQTYLKKHFIN